jgi:DNA-binding winged helix-turn-helix (wHTH) protein/tetratricopeptide (TPR) repeat protein
MTACYHFADFRLDPARRLLWRGNRSLRLPPRAFDLLLVLVGSPNEVLTKDDLLTTLWPDSFVEESNLSQYVFLLRKALGQTLTANRFILTVPGRGYRFIADVTTRSQDGAPDAALTTARRIRSIAVLPFQWIGTKPPDDSLDVVLADALITRLSHVEQMAVRPTASVVSRADADPLTAGRELAVDAVLTGRLQRADDTLRVTAQFVSVADGALLWAERFDESRRHVLIVQDALANAVAAALMPMLSDGDRAHATPRPAMSAGAYEAYLKGRHCATTWTETGWRKGIEYFNQAIAIDPACALAYAGLAESHYIASNLYLPPRDAMPRAKAAALKAVELDEALADAHASLALALAFFDANWIDAERAFRRAIDLNPRHVTARLWYGRFLTVQRRFTEAMAELSSGQALDPLSAGLNAEIGRTLLCMRQYDAAIVQLQETLEVTPRFWPAHMFLGWAYEQKGLYTEAVGILAHASALDDNPRTLASLGHAYGASGRSADARGVLRQLIEQAVGRYVSPYYMAAVHVALGEVDRAFDWLEQAWLDKSEWLIWLNVDPRLDGLRADPRFDTLVRRVGLPEGGRI